MNDGRRGVDGPGRDVDASAPGGAAPAQPDDGDEDRPDAGPLGDRLGGGRLLSLTLVAVAALAALSAVRYASGRRAEPPTWADVGLSALGVPEPLAREARRPGTPIAADFDAYSRFLRENGLADAVLVAWVRSDDGSADRHAIRPLASRDTFVRLILDLPDLVADGPRETRLYREAILHEWPNPSYWRRENLEWLLGPETWFPD